MAGTSAGAKTTPEAVLRSLIGRFPPKDQKLIRAVRSAVRKRLPTANELVYDYTSSLVLAYTPTELGADGILSIAARADGVRLYFGRGSRLPDPKKLLLGSAGVRFIVMETPRRLAHPDVKALIAAAIDEAAVPLPSKGRGRLIDRSAAQEKRRRKAVK
ncbi:MAG: hypothetical protein ACHQXA_01890 [Gemmatimonadales bacterium]